MDRINLLEPLSLSNTSNELERAMQAAFIQTYAEMLGEDLQAIFDYSTPHMAGAEVVERFTKKDGLVVLRRPNTSETLMRVIYATWVGMGSKRGLNFLDFVLRMLWPNQYSIRRLFHPKKMAQDYPKRLTYIENQDNFLTSRIHITMSDEVDMRELTELAPTLTKLVPANVVPSIAVNIEVSDLALVSAIGARPMMINSFTPEF